MNAGKKEESGKIFRWRRKREVIEKCKRKTGKRLNMEENGKVKYGRKREV